MSWGLPKKQGLYKNPRDYVQSPGNLKSLYRVYKVKKEKRMKLLYWLFFRYFGDEWCFNFKG